MDDKASGDDHAKQLNAYSQVIAFMMRGPGEKKKITRLTFSNTVTSERRQYYQRPGLWLYSWTISLAAMYMYEEVAVRIWDRGGTEGDVKSLYRDCHKGPIPHIRNKIVFLLPAIHFTYLSMRLNLTWITVIFNLHCISRVTILYEIVEFQHSLHGLLRICHILP